MSVPRPGRAWSWTLAVFLVALVARGVVVAWAAGRFAPSGDGFYYDILGARLAEGHGYSWLGEDGSVAPAGHYPVGYPALLAAAFAIAGHHDASAMLLNALLGAIGAAALHRALLVVSRPAVAFYFALIGFALHPALVGYTAAIMTEGICATVLALALWITLTGGAASGRAKLGLFALVGGVLGLGTLLRPQLLLLAPVLVVFAAWGDRGRRIAVCVALTSVAALSVVAPWTARNCAVLDRCALVSVNGGWNLLIGTDPEARGTWAPLRVPDACAEVTLEAAKDRCFGSAAVAAIRARPGAWLGLAPSKLATTFNHVGAAPWYLHQANPAAFPLSARYATAALEQLWQRILTALALLAASHGLLTRWRARSAYGSWVTRAVVLAIGLAVPGWIAMLLFCGLALGAPSSPPLRRRALQVSGAAILATALTHVLFFGAGRYGLVVIPFIIVAAGSIGAPSLVRRAG